MPKRTGDTKVCSVCRQPKHVDEYGKKRLSPDGLHYTCKVCDRRRQREFAQRKVAALARVAAEPEPLSVDIDLSELSPGTSVAQASVLSPVESAHSFRNQERAKRDLKSEHAALLEENEQLKKERDEFLKLTTRSPEVIVYDKAKHLRSDSIAFAAASDWHVEEPVFKETVHGLNEYNLEIAKSRAEYFFRNLLALANMMAKDTTIKTIFIAFLGDFFSGWIHDELMANTLLAPGDAAHFVEGLLISGIDFLLEEGDFNIEGEMIPGNHGRMTDKVHFGDPTGTSLETFMYRAVANRYHDNPRVNLHVAGQAMVYRDFYEKFKMRLIHGYEVKFGGGVGGLTIPLRKALAQWNNPIRADLTVFGHFHQFFDGGDFLGNGSLIGYNLYAQAIKAAYEEARQAFWLVHARKGGQKSITAPIWLDNAHHIIRPGDLLAG